jgi:membrane complex biogenesis BtpA family protein
MNEIKGIIRPGGRFVIGMVHCLPLPGTHGYRGDVGMVYAQAVQDAKTLEKCGVDAVIVENMGDAPFAEKLDKAQAAALAVATAKVRETVKIPIGVDAAFNDYETAISIAHAADCQFVRIPVFVDTVEFYGGIISPCARDCMSFRRSIAADGIMVLADIQVKHTNMLLPYISIERSAKDAAACFADALIVTGSATAEETPLEMVERVKKVVNIPVIAGSGVTAANISEQLRIADGAIIGSSLKVGGVLSNPVSEERVNEVMSALKGG